MLTLQLIHSCIVAVLVAAVPLSNMFVVNGVSVARIVGLVAAISAGCLIIIRGSLKTWPPELCFLAAFVLWNGFAVFWSLSPDISTSRFLVYVNILLAAIVLWEAVRMRTRHLVLTAFVVGSCALVGIIIWQYTVYGIPAIVDDSVARYGAFDTDVNELAVTIGLALPLLLGLLRRTTLPEMIIDALSVGAIGVFLWAVFLTGSRSGALAAVTGIGVYWLVLPNSLLRRLITLGGMVGGVAALFALGALPQETVERLTTLGQAMGDPGDLDRVRLWNAGMKSFLDGSPLWGVGPGVYRTAIAGHTAGINPNVAHNSFLSLLVETGLVGFVLFCTVLLTVSRKLVRTSGSIGASFVGAAACWLIGASFLTWEYASLSWVPLLMMSFAARYELRRKPSRMQAVNGGWR